MDLRGDLEAPVDDPGDTVASVPAPARKHFKLKTVAVSLFDLSFFCSYSRIF